MQEEFAVESLNGDWYDVFAGDEVERSVGVIEEWLRFQGFKAYYLESSGTCNAELRSEEINRRGLCGNIEFLEIVSEILQ